MLSRDPSWRPMQDHRRQSMQPAEPRLQLAKMQHTSSFEPEAIESLLVQPSCAVEAVTSENMIERASELVTF